LGTVHCRLRRIDGFADFVAGRIRRKSDSIRRPVCCVVQTIKSNLKVDWTEPHRDDVRAAIRAAVRRVLRKNVKADDFGPFVEKFMAQAEPLYAEWPLAA
jgi:hypothetical protein